MKPIRYALLLGPFAALALTGCANLAAEDALERARAHCASEGKQFIQKQTEVHEGLIISDAMVSGECVGPGDPGFVPPPAPHG